MTVLAKETARIVDSLPADKAEALLAYARYLASVADEEAWDRRAEDPRYAPKLKALMREIEAEIAQGRTQPLDPDRL